MLQRTVRPCKSCAVYIIFTVVTFKTGGKAKGVWGFC